MNKNNIDTWRKVVELYKSGQQPSTISRKLGVNVREIRHKCRQYDLCGCVPESRSHSFRASKAFKQRAVDAFVKESLSYAAVTLKFNIGRSTLQKWVRSYRHGGYEELLATKPKGRRTKVSKPKRTKGMSEIERLREENEFLKAENAYLKKLKALDQEESAEMFGIGPKSSTN